MHCTRCGTQMIDNSGFCQNCGQPAGAGGTGIVGQPTTVGAAVVPNAQSSATTTLQPNVAAALCYLAGLITGILFLVLEPYRRDRFVRFHAFQSIFFNVAWIVVYLALGMLQSLLPWSLWHFVATLSSLVSLAIFCGVLWLMYRAYNNERFKIPVIGELAEKQA